MNSAAENGHLEILKIKSLWLEKNKENPAKYLAGFY
jgi:hypothetical protein